jgi:hypothetical protein
MTHWHCVYFVQVDDRIKIGWSHWPEHRAKLLGGTLLAFIPSDDPINQLKAERMEQKRWAHLCIEGEWFRPDPELLERIRLIRESQ